MLPVNLKAFGEPPVMSDPYETLLEPIKTSLRKLLHAPGPGRVTT